jgi:hypothetical protein
MIDQFEKLGNSDLDVMLKAPILVCILIAGADGTIDKKEIKEAIAFAQKQAKAHTSLANYFKEVSQDFEDKLKILIQGYPYESTLRNSIIVEELTQLNTILGKLDKTFSKQFYTSLKGIAEKIASSSGGLLGINSVGEEEAKLVRLSMIKDPGETQ